MIKIKLYIKLLNGVIVCIIYTQCKTIFLYFLKREFLNNHQLDNSVITFLKNNNCSCANLGVCFVHNLMFRDFYF